nr:ribonuclease H-like domain-containing protein [Tanacetum cinerariifolium]
MWSTAIKIALIGKNKFGLVDGTCVKPVTSHVLTQQWERCNAIVLGWILSSLSPDLYLGELSMHGYYHKPNSLWREFDTLTLLPACTCATYEGVLKHNQLIILMQFLMGLNDAYLNIKSNILARYPLPNVKEAFNVVSKEESRRGLHPRPGSIFGTKVQPNAFVAKSNNFKGNKAKRGKNNAGGNSFRNSSGKVFNHNTEAPKGASTSSGSTSFDTQFTKYQMMKILFLINDKPSGNANANMAGANQHLTNCTKNMFNVSNISCLNLTVGHPNGTLAKITAIGSLRLTTNVVLFDVLVIPEYNVSLMSMHKLIKDSKLFVGFDETKCYIQDLNLVKTLGISSEAVGLYFFDVEQCGNSIVGHANSTFVCHKYKQLWYSRLGHPTDHVLSILSGKIGLKYYKHVSPCDIYHKAKQTKEPFPLSNHKSLAVGDLVHLDLWGPYRVVSRDGYKYFLTIVDDYSRFPSSVLSGASPYLLVYGKEPSLSHIRLKKDQEKDKIESKLDKKGSVAKLGNVKSSYSR